MMTLPAIQCNISSIQIGRSPGFLSRGTKRHAKNGSNNGERLSAVDSFLMTSAVSSHKSVELVRIFFLIKIHLHLSACSSHGPAPALVLTAGLFTKSASIVSNFIGCFCSGVSVSKISSSASLPCGCFCCKWF